MVMSLSSCAMSMSFGAHLDSWSVIRYQQLDVKPYSIAVEHYSMRLPNNTYIYSPHLSRWIPVFKDDRMFASIVGDISGNIPALVMTSDQAEEIFINLIRDVLELRKREHLDRKVPMQRRANEFCFYRSQGAFNRQCDRFNRIRTNSWSSVERDMCRCSYGLLVGCIFDEGHGY